MYIMNKNNWIKKEKIDIEKLSHEHKLNIEFINNHLVNSNKTVSNIASGIGDILLYKSNHPNSKIYWNIKHLLNYKSFPANLINIKFNIELLLKLFGKKNIEIFYNSNVKIDQEHLTTLRFQPNLINLFNISQNTYNFKYIIIHTKLRFSFNHSGTFIRDIKLKLKHFFSNFKAKHKILILGEKKIDKNNATKALPTITTIYEECILLKNNNDVIDLTEEMMYNTPDMKRFERDIKIINDSELNIGFGHGGQFCFNLLFSKKSLYYCPPRLVNFQIENPNINIITNIDNFIRQCEQDMS